MSKKDIMLFHRYQLGYIFQNYALIDDESVYQNLKLALKYTTVSKIEYPRKIAEALEVIGLSGYEGKQIYQLSGGEQQRISLARLYLKPCEIILADEPTGSLDKKNKEIVLKLLVRFKEMGKTIVVVTHDDDIVRIADVHLTFGVDI